MVSAAVSGTSGDLIGWCHRELVIVETIPNTRCTVAGGGTGRAFNAGRMADAAPGLGASSAIATFGSSPTSFRPIDENLQSAPQMCFRCPDLAGRRETQPPHRELRRDRRRSATVRTGYFITIKP